MAEAVFVFASPEKFRAVFEEVQIVGEVDPGLGFFVEDGMSSTRRRIVEEEIKLVLHSIESFDGDLGGIGQPDHSGQKGVGSITDLHPFDFACGDGDDTEFNARIGSPGLGVALGLSEGTFAGEISLRIDKFFGDIELEKGDLLGIRRPPGGGAEVEFFGVDPIELAV